MALSNNTIWELRTTGSDANGGGFVAGAGTDYSQQDAAEYTFTDLACADAALAAPVVTSASHNFVTADEGNIIYISAGAGWTVGRYQIVSTSGNAATLDRAVGTGSLTNGTFAVGGALATHATALSSIVARNIVYVKAGTYTITTTVSYVLAGFWVSQVVGYDTNRTLTNTDATRPTLTTATNSVALITGNAGGAICFKNHDFTTSAGTPAAAISNTTAGSGSSGKWTFINCTFNSGFTTVLTSTNNGSTVKSAFVNCEVSGITGDAFLQTTGSGDVILYNCYIHDCGGDGISGAASAMCNINRCIITNNGAYGIQLASPTAGTIATNIIANNIIANNTSGQIDAPMTSGVSLGIILINNIIYGAGDLLDIATEYMDRTFFAYNNAFGGGGSNTNYTTGSGDITLSASPFTDADNEDYSLNNTAGGGALLRGTGWPSPIFGSSTDSFLDVGQAQHEESAVVGVVSSPKTQRNLPDLRIW